MVAYTLWAVLLLSVGLTSSNKRDIHSLQDQGKTDNTTKVNFSVMVWTTQEFEESFGDKSEMKELIERVFKHTNEGFDNSKIPVQAVLHEIKIHPTLRENKETREQWDNGKTLELVDLENSMPKDKLLNCADAATFFVLDWGEHGDGGHGGATIRRTKSCNTFSIITKKGLYTLGHELAHNFGANHDVEQMKKQKEKKSWHNHGHLIQPQGSGPGYRTIMAYSASGHKKQVNYYSNPDVLYPGTGTPTGVRGVSNNARVITENRFLMASCGKEESNGRCNNCQIYPDTDVCTTCCDTVQFRGNTPYAGTYTIYKAKPRIHNRNVYKHQTEDYCLFYGWDFWSFDDCNKVGAKISPLRSSRTGNSCVHSEKLSWNIEGQVEPMCSQ